MSKKKAKKAAILVQQPQPEVMVADSFDYEEMLSELEAIVAEAEVRIQDEESLA